MVNHDSCKMYWSFLGGRDAIWNHSVCVDICMYSYIQCIFSNMKSLWNSWWISLKNKISLGQSWFFGNPDFFFPHLWRIWFYILVIFFSPLSGRSYSFWSLLKAWPPLSSSFATLNFRRRWQKFFKAFVSFWLCHVGSKKVASLNQTMPA